MARIAAKIKQDPKFQALLGALGSEEKAKIAFDRLQPAAPEVDPRMQTLLDAGLTPEQAEQALTEDEAPAEPTKLAQVTPLSSKERAEALVADKGYEYTKGRVYGGPSLAESIVRVHKTGKPEIVSSSGVGRTKGVLVYKEDSGDVALQNLTQNA